MEINEKWDRRFLELAKHISSWSKDPSTKVGAVLVNPDNRIVVGIGYNGFARGVQDTDERLNMRELKYKFVVHAEVNAILMASAGGQTRGSILYVWPAFDIPNICHDCAKTAIQAGVKEVIGYIPGQIKESWKESLAISKTMFDEAGVTYRGIKL